MAMIMGSDDRRSPNAGGPPPGPNDLRPLDLAAWLASHRQLAASQPGRADGPAASCQTPHGDLQRRAARYLERIPGAISGHHGHDRTFHAACVLIKGFGLSIDSARSLLQDWNQRCEPPWSAQELEHKLQSAHASADTRPRGYLVKDGLERSAAGAIRSTPPSSRSNPTTAAPAPITTAGQETNPHRLARLFLDQRFRHPEGIGLRYWREQFHEWDGSVYRTVALAEMRAQVTQTLAAEFDQLFQQAAAGRSLEQGEEPLARGPAPRPIAVTSRLVGDVLQAVAGLVLIRVAEIASQPAWVENIPAMKLPCPGTRDDGPPRWPIDETLPTRNALIHLPSFVEKTACRISITPRFFNAFALDYDFVTDAMQPVEWLDFLDEIWQGDPESVSCLQEWFGYLLTPDTRQQKILMMVGPKQSGRGTIARVLKALVGAGNVVNPTLATLARPFVLAPLIDKSVAIFPDARLSSRPDNAAIVECLLSISGQDDQTIDRKRLPAWTGPLPTRFVLISNELPRLRDASGALASRLILLRFTRSFYGQEDTGLFERLSRDMPGILLWAIAGWERLRRRGRFLQPRSGRELLEAMEDLGSPISAFLRERCVVGPGESTPVSALYETWRSWCQEQGRDAIGDEPSFGRDLRAAVPGVSKSRFRQGTARIAHYRGIRLRTPLDQDHDRRDDGHQGMDSGVDRSPPPF
jgi:putative DNA primase/helicase